MPDVNVLRLAPKIRAACQQAIELLSGSQSGDLAELAAAALTLEAAERNLLDTVRALRQLPTSTGPAGITPTRGRAVERCYSWQDIGDVLGIRRQSAHERFASRLAVSADTASS